MGTFRVDDVLQYLSLALGVANSFLIARQHLRDKPKIRVYFIHPDVYQWWFELPPGDYKGSPTRRFGFLLYVAIANSGLRADTLVSWRLYMRARNGQQYELQPRNLPTPIAKSVVPGHAKVWNVLGQQGLYSSGETRVEPGSSIGGLAYYLMEVWGSESYDPEVRDGKIRATLKVSTVLGHQAKGTVVLQHQPLEKVEEILPGLRDIS